MEVSNLSLVYLLTHLGRRILGFFRHWYIDGFLRGIHIFYGILERLDKIFALRINFKNLFQPLYQDYSAIGYLWGFIFRSIRVLAGSLAYLLLILLSAMLYLAWALVPPLIIYKIFNP